MTTKMSIESIVGQLGIDHEEFLKWKELNIEHVAIVSQTIPRLTYLTKRKLVVGDQNLLRGTGAQGPSYSGARIGICLRLPIEVSVS